jgi:DNA-binding SARP family transcriptional activator
MLRLQTFGGLSLFRDGELLTRAGKQRTRLMLLTLLAASSRTGMTRDKLMLYLWPESEMRKARGRLKQALYVIRRELGAEVITGVSTLSLNGALVTSDLQELDAAVLRRDHASAAALHTGPLLDGIHFGRDYELERWVVAQRARLAHAWAGAVECVAFAAESAGAWREAVAWRRQLAAAEPCSARTTIALMRALAESGDVGGSLQQYRLHSTHVAHELETRAEPEVVALAESLSAGNWRRSRPIAAPSVPLPSRGHVAVPADPPTRLATLVGTALGVFHALARLRASMVGAAPRVGIFLRRHPLPGIG